MNYKEFLESIGVADEPGAVLGLVEGLAVESGRRYNEQSIDALRGTAYRDIARDTSVMRETLTGLQRAVRTEQGRREAQAKFQQEQFEAQAKIQQNAQRLVPVIARRMDREFLSGASKEDQDTARNSLFGLAVKERQLDDEYNKITDEEFVSDEGQAKLAALNIIEGIQNQQSAEGLERAGQTREGFEQYKRQIQFDELYANRNESNFDVGRFIRNSVAGTVELGGSVINLGLSAADTIAPGNVLSQAGETVGSIADDAGRFIDDNTPANLLASERTNQTLQAYKAGDLTEAQLVAQLARDQSLESIGGALPDVAGALLTGAPIARGLTAVAGRGGQFLNRGGFGAVLAGQSGEFQDNAAAVDDPNRGEQALTTIGGTALLSGAGNLLSRLGLGNIESAVGSRGRSALGGSPLLRRNVTSDGIAGPSRTARLGRLGSRTVGGTGGEFVQESAEDILSQLVAQAASDDIGVLEGLDSFQPIDRGQTLASGTVGGILGSGFGLGRGIAGQRTETENQAINRELADRGLLTREQTRLGQFADEQGERLKLLEEARILEENFQGRQEFRRLQDANAPRRFDPAVDGVAGPGFSQTAVDAPLADPTLIEDGKQLNANTTLGASFAPTFSQRYDPLVSQAFGVLNPDDPVAVAEYNARQAEVNANAGRALLTNDASPLPQPNTLQRAADGIRNTFRNPDQTGVRGAGLDVNRLGLPTRRPFEVPPRPPAQPTPQGVTGNPFAAKPADVTTPVNREVSDIEQAIQSGQILDESQLFGGEPTLNRADIPTATVAEINKNTRNLNRKIAEKAKASGQVSEDQATFNADVANPVLGGDLGAQLLDSIRGNQSPTAGSTPGSQPASPTAGTVPNPSTINRNPTPPPAPASVAPAPTPPPAPAPAAAAVPAAPAATRTPAQIAADTTAAILNGNPTPPPAPEDTTVSRLDSLEQQLVQAELDQQNGTVDRETSEDTIADLQAAIALERTTTGAAPATTTEPENEVTTRQEAAAPETNTGPTAASVAAAPSGPNAPTTSVLEDVRERGFVGGEFSPVRQALEEALPVNGDKKFVAPGSSSLVTIGGFERTEGNLLEAIIKTTDGRRFTVDSFLRGNIQTAQAKRLVELYDSYTAAQLEQTGNERQGFVDAAAEARARREAARGQIQEQAELVTGAEAVAEAKVKQATGTAQIDPEVKPTDSAEVTAAKQELQQAQDDAVVTAEEAVDVSGVAADADATVQSVASLTRMRNDVTAARNAHKEAKKQVDANPNDAEAASFVDQAKANFEALRDVYNGLVNKFNTEGTPAGVVLAQPIDTYKNNESDRDSLADALAQETSTIANGDGTSTGSTAPVDPDGAVPTFNITKNKFSVNPVEGDSFLGDVEPSSFRVIKMDGRYGVAFDNNVPKGDAVNLLEVEGETIVPDSYRKKEGSRKISLGGSASAFSTWLNSEQPLAKRARTLLWGITGKKLKGGVLSPASSGETSTISQTEGRGQISATQPRQLGPTNVFSPLNQRGASRSKSQRQEVEALENQRTATPTPNPTSPRKKERQAENSESKEVKRKKNKPTIKLRENKKPQNEEKLETRNESLTRKISERFEGESNSDPLLVGSPSTANPMPQGMVDILTEYLTVGGLSLSDRAVALTGAADAERLTVRLAKLLLRANTTDQIEIDINELIRQFEEVSPELGLRQDGTKDPGEVYQTLAAITDGYIKQELQPGYDIINNTDAVKFFLDPTEFAVLLRSKFKNLELQPLNTLSVINDALAIEGPIAEQSNNTNEVTDNDISNDIDELGDAEFLTDEELARIEAEVLAENRTSGIADELGFGTLPLSTGYDELDAQEAYDLEAITETYGSDRIIFGPDGNQRRSDHVPVPLSFDRARKVTQQFFGNKAALKNVEFVTLDDINPSFSSYIQENSGEPVDYRTKMFVSDGKLYIFPDHIGSDNDLRIYLAHEILGHVGLRERFGPRLNGILDELFLALGGVDGVLARDADISANLRKNYPVTVQSAREGEKQAQRNLTEELLAHLAEKGTLDLERPQLSILKRAAQQVRRWLRRRLPSTLSSMFDWTVSDAELLYLVSEANHAGRKIFDSERPFSTPRALQVRSIDNAFSDGWRKTVEKGRTWQPHNSELIGDIIALLGFDSTNTPGDAWSNLDEKIKKSAREFKRNPGNWYNKTKTAIAHDRTNLHNEMANIKDYIRDNPDVMNHALRAITAPLSGTLTTVRKGVEKEARQRDYDHFVKNMMNWIGGANQTDAEKRAKLLTFMSLDLHETLDHSDAESEMRRDSQEILGRMEDHFKRIEGAIPGKYKNSKASVEAFDTYFGMITAKERNESFFFDTRKNKDFWYGVKKDEKKGIEGKPSALKKTGKDLIDEARKRTKSVNPDKAWSMERFAAFERAVIKRYTKRTFTIPRKADKEGLSLIARERKDFVTDFVTDAAADAKLTELGVVPGTSNYNKALHEALEGAWPDYRKINDMALAKRQSYGASSVEETQAIKYYDWKYYVPRIGERDKDQDTIFDDNLRQADTLATTFMEARGKQTESIPPFAAALHNLAKAYHGEADNTMKRAVATLYTAYQQDLVSDAAGDRSINGQALDFGEANAFYINKGTPEYTKAMRSIKPDDIIIHFDPETDINTVIDDPALLNQYKKDNSGRVLILKFGKDSELMTMVKGKRRASGAATYMRKNFPHLARAASYFGQMHTTYNPNYPLVQLVRDTMASFWTVAADGGFPAAKQYITALMNQKGKLRKMAEYMYHVDQNGADSAKLAAKLRKDPELERFIQWHTIGAPVQFSQALSMDSAMESYIRGFSNRALNRSLKGKVDQGDSIIRLATIMTDTIGRFAAFESQLDQGKSAEEAAAFAKNIANFERRGSSAAADLGSIAFMFFRPTVIGAFQITDTLLDSKYNTEAAGIAAGLGVLFFAMGAMLSPEDEEGNNLFLTQQPSTTHLRWWLSEDFSIQMPYSYNPFTALMATTVQVMYGMTGNQSAMATAGNIFDVMANNVSPVSNNIPLTNDSGEFDIGLLGAKFTDMVTPTLATPLVALGLNRSSFGNEISPWAGSLYGPGTLGETFNSTRGQVGGISEAIARQLFDTFGFSPDVRRMDFLMTELASGPRNFANTILEWSRILTAENYSADWKRAGFGVGSFIGSPHNRTKSDFYRVRSVLRSAQKDIKSLRDTGIYDEEQIAEIMTSQYGESVVNDLDVIKDTDKSLRDLNTKIKAERVTALRGSAYRMDEIEQLDSQVKRAMARGVGQLDGEY